MADNFIFYGNWIESIKHLDPDVQARIVNDIVRYGVGEDPLFGDDVAVQMAVNFVKGSIDRSKDEYAKRKKWGDSGGRKKEIDDDLIGVYANEGKTAKEIAMIMGRSESSIYHSDGWKNRSVK